jgi:hypothetical protein
VTHLTKEVVISSNDHPGAFFYRYPSREDYDKIAGTILNVLRIPHSRENMVNELHLKQLGSSFSHRLGKMERDRANEIQERKTAECG